MRCRHCSSELTLPFVDLGTAPPSNAYVSEQALRSPEKWYPLRLLVCERCWLVQTEDFVGAEELFCPEYPYFSSFSTSWLEHCEQYVLEMMSRFSLNRNSHVVEIAANDGYLLQYVEAHRIPCMGIEPTAATAAAARAKGIPIVESFFGSKLAKHLVGDGDSADLLIANNVLAHVPEINDFVLGFATLLKPEGVATFEFPHLLRMVNNTQFDTIYHEHFSYLSLTSTERIFSSNGLSIFDVQEHPTHGGSLRVFAQRADTQIHPRKPAVDSMLNKETEAGMTTRAFYEGFQKRVDELKNAFLSFLIDAKCNGRSVSAYGAAAKGNTLLNYAGIRPDVMSFVVDRNPAKQGKYMPGSRIPIVNESRLKEAKPNYVAVLPWNLKPEVMQQLEYIRAWGGRFVTAVPTLTVA